MNEETKATRTVSVVLPVEQRSWLIRQAAERAADTGGRASVSEIVRELVEQAQATRYTAA
jgi:Arc/MetJ-type ribon-helix-helix transcriptional regulator